MGTLQPLRPLHKLDEPLPPLEPGGVTAVTDAKLFGEREGRRFSNLPWASIACPSLFPLQPSLVFHGLLSHLLPNLLPNLLSPSLLALIWNTGTPFGDSPFDEIDDGDDETFGAIKDIDVRNHRPTQRALASPCVTTTSPYPSTRVTTSARNHPLTDVRVTTALTHIWNDARP